MVSHQYGISCDFLAFEEFYMIRTLDSDRTVLQNDSFGVLLNDRIVCKLFHKNYI